jgi:acyl carrier protein
MSKQREQWLVDLKHFLRTIQKPNRPVESVGVDERLVASGLVDSLAIMQIVVYLEEHHGIDFAAGGFDPDRLATMGSIVDLIEEARA